MTLIKQLNYTNKETFSDVRKLQKKVMENPNSVKTDTMLINQIDPLKGYLMEFREKKDNWTLYRIEFSTKKEEGSDEFARAIKFLVQCDESAGLAQVIGYYDLLDEAEDQELENNYQDYRLYEELNMLFESEIQGCLGVEENEESGLIEEGKDANTDQPF